MKFSDLSGAAKAAAILAILSLVISINFTSTSTINGVSTCSFTDYGRIGFGGLALLVGLGGLASARAMRSSVRKANLTVSGIAAVVGALAVLYGLGLILSPC
ncbi:hypothetical protein HKCCE4037_05720 [Rhodobacterales bacterium HKCCE4037]|nr:hypothetical protein [Rhodobacterales bacterium HKCCE4037]